MRLRTRVHEIVEVARAGDGASRAFDISLVSLISLNVIAIVLESVQSIYATGPEFFRVFEVASVAVFTAEYVLRVWSCVENRTFARPIRGRLRFMMTPLAVIDLLAILPFYVGGGILDLRFLRALRLARLFRVAKLGRYSSSLQLLGRVIQAKKYELGVTLFVMFLLLIIASCLMYYVESEVQPDVFTSIPAAMWWGVATLTTVGYGDTYPITPGGKIVASLMAVLGIGMFALPAGILGGGFMEAVQERRRRVRRCPRCGADLSDLA